jgi:hypothetical protein
MLGYFNIRKYDCFDDTLLSDCYYCNKGKGNFINVASCLLGPQSAQQLCSNCALLDVLFTNINILSVSISNYPTITPDNYHPLLNLDFKLTYDCQHTFLTFHHNYSREGHLLL